MYFRKRKLVYWLCVRFEVDAFSVVVRLSETMCLKQCSRAFSRFCLGNYPGVSNDKSNWFWGRGHIQNPETREMRVFGLSHRQIVIYTKPKQNNSPELLNLLSKHIPIKITQQCPNICLYLFLCFPVIFPMILIRWGGGEEAISGAPKYTKSDKKQFRNTETDAKTLSKERYVQGEQRG